MLVFKVHKYLIKKYAGIYYRIVAEDPYDISKTKTSNSIWFLSKFINKLVFYHYATVLFLLQFAKRGMNMMETWFLLFDRVRSWLLREREAF